MPGRTRPNRLRPPSIYLPLSRAIAWLTKDRTPDRSHVYVESIGDSPFYVQFAFSNGVLRYEAVSNRYLREGFRLNEREHRALRGLGWLHPDHDSPNWNRMELVDRAFDFAAVARVVQRTFSEVYGVLPEGLLLRCTWPDHEGGCYAFRARILVEHGWGWCGVGVEQARWRN
jgi:hypothetical protein